MPKGIEKQLMRRAAVTVALLAGACLAPATATADTTPQLPAPTGPFSVGTTSLHLTDESRPDPWVPRAGNRELMVSLWYPTKARHGQRAQYMTARESALLLEGAGVTGLPHDTLSRTRTHARTDVNPAGRARSLPLVVLSPGFGWPRSSLTSLAEDLASNGYLVAALDHTYESFGTTFPDGRVTTCAVCQLEEGEELGTRLQRSRAADISFVLDELTGPHAPWRGAALLDPARIAMAGSSLGGASSIETMLRDARVRAGINMDGQFFAPVPEAGMDRPFMFMGQPLHRPGGPDASWDTTWQRLTGWRRWLVVEGSVHASFTDYDLLTQQIGVDLGSALPGARSAQITRRYVRAFLDQHLRTRPQPLLTKPSQRYPEVTFHAP